MTQFARLSVRNLFIADAHLGVSGSPALALGYLLDRTLVSDQIYILGDFIEGRSLSSGAVLPSAHAEVIERLQASAANGVPVVYIPGDRDGQLRSWLESEGTADYEAGHRAELDGLTLQEHGWHTDGAGHRHLLIHGDETEPSDTQNQGWARKAFSRLQVAMGLAQDGTEGFIERKLALAAEWKADGIICGHNPQPASRMSGRLFYRNPGHWAQHRSVLVETDDGRFVHLDWGDVLQRMENRSVCDVFDGLACQLELNVVQSDVKLSHHNVLGPVPDRPPSVGHAKLLAAVSYRG
jgi:UDP-2,3-diacylglucosamine pyrophosphatase LpxH